MKLKRLSTIAVLIGVGAAILAALFVRPDLPRQQLIRKYAGANSRFVRLPDGSAAHVELFGPSNRPVVVLLHGAMSSVQAWSGWTAALSANHRVIAIDLPGNGLTGATGSGDYSRAGMVAFTHDVLAALGVDHAALVGHSMGGGVAAEFAERYPRAVWALVLIDAAGIPMTGSQETTTAKLARNPVTRALLPWIMPRAAVSGGLRKTFGDPSKLTDARVDEIVELERFPGNRRGLIGHYLAKSDDQAVEAGLPALKTPTLVEWGGSDSVQPLAAGETFVRLIPGARLIVYPGAGHMLIEEAPAASERDAAAFLASAEPQPASKE